MSSQDMDAPLPLRLMLEPLDLPSRQPSWEEDDSMFRDNGEVYVQGYLIPIHISHEELLFQGTIGRGACSYVQRWRHRVTGKLYAVKIFDLYNSDTKGQLVREIQVLSTVDCPSLVTFYGAFHRDAKIGMVLEYMDRGSLNDIVEAHFHLPERTLAAMTYQILIGLAYLHYEGRLHRDVKPSNILLNSKGEVKLSDFGIARELEAEGGFAETMVGTVKYMSPERLDGEQYGPASDIWSLGIVLLELWRSEHMFSNEENHLELVEMFHTTRIEDILPVQDLPPAFREFMLSCIALDPSDRVIAAVLLHSPWFVQWNIVESSEVMEPTGYGIAVNICREWMDTLNDGYRRSIQQLPDDELYSNIDSSGSDIDDDGADVVALRLAEVEFERRSVTSLHSPVAPMSPLSPSPGVSTGRPSNRFSLTDLEPPRVNVRAALQTSPLSSPSEAPGTASFEDAQTEFPTE